jgi:hypothetical protein
MWILEGCMSKGPKLNKLPKNFTTRDSLGIEGVANSISAELCPIVNTVTPRAFYWPFMVWIYYDFYKYSGIEDRNVDRFDEYLKRQDYFFVLANLLTTGSDQENMVGKQQAKVDKDESDGPYYYNPAYFKIRYGGMQYYNAGCLSMGFIIDHNPENPDETYKFPKLTKDGERMALAFEKVIRDTEYYKNYRRNDLAVPREVLEKFGKVINIGLVRFDECKELLRNKLFEHNYKLSKSADYIKYLWQECRRIFFDYETSNGVHIELPEQLSEVGRGWEIVVGRQYFTVGLEMIWKYMLEQLVEPVSREAWIKDIFSLSDFSFSLDVKLEGVLSDCEFSFAEREKFINDSRRKNNETSSVENGIKLILSVYNRFHNMEDIGEEKVFFDYGLEDNISFSEFFNIVDEYKVYPIKDFIVFVMDVWLIQQHYVTAFNKMLFGRDGFYYEIINGLYFRKHEFNLDFQGIRMVQLSKVMQDLDML